MRQVFDGKQMQQMDGWAIHQLGIPGRVLMERAAEALCRRVMEEAPTRVVVLCGTGNNGGDGFAAARLLWERGVKVRVFIIGKPERLSGTGDAAHNFRRLAEFSIPVVWGVPEEEEPDCIVDALFGTGLDRPIVGEAARAIAWMNAQKAMVIAADIPSGVHAGTGQVLGCAVQAARTVTFSRMKTGLCLYPGRRLAGRVDVEDIGVPSPNPIEETADSWTLDARAAGQILPPRRMDSHKGTYGKATIVAGSPGMMGAATFAASAAYRVGAGLVRCLIPEQGSAAMTIRVPEAVQILYREEETPALPEDSTAVLIGPGLGRNEALFHHCMKNVPQGTPLVVDADGLNLLAKHPEWGRAGMILTPHMGEASRLAHKSVEELYEDLPRSAQELARQYQSIVVLKCASTVTADPEGHAVINTTGNPGMSTAGSGDVLAGILAGLLAQTRKSTWQLAALGAWLHGRAGDEAAGERGLYALMASDILQFLRPDFLIQE